LGFKGICKGGNKNQQLPCFLFYIIPAKLSLKWLKKRFDSYQFRQRPPMACSETLYMRLPLVISGFEYLQITV